MALALVVSGAGDARWGSGGDSLLNVYGLWRGVDVELARARGTDAAPAGDGEFERRETAWQARENSIFSAAQAPPSVVMGHLALMEGERAAGLEELIRVGAECGWQPAGPGVGNHMRPLLVCRKSWWRSA